VSEKDRFGHIILVDSVGDVLETDDILVEIYGGFIKNWFCLFDEFFDKLRPFTKSRTDYLYGIWSLKESLDDPEWLRESTGKGRIYIHISDVEKALPNPDDNHLKYEFFNMMVNIANDRIFLLLDRPYRDSLMGCLDTHRYCKERLEAENTIRRRQILFIERLEDIKLIEEEFIVTVEGKRCAALKTFYEELSIKLNFRKGFGRNLAAIDECINEFDYSNLADGKVIDYSNYSYISFIYFKDAREILPNNDSERSAFFDILNTMCNERTFIIINKSDMDFVLGEAERYKKTREEEMRIWRLEEQKKKEKALKKEQKPLTPHQK
jgi:hypothetical protein